MAYEALPEFPGSRSGAQERADAALSPCRGAGAGRVRHPLRHQCLLMAFRELALSALKNPFGIRADRVSCDIDCFCNVLHPHCCDAARPPLLTQRGQGPYPEFPTWRRAIKSANSDISATAKPSEAISKSRRSSFAIPFFGQAARNRLAVSENPIAQSP